MRLYSIPLSIVVIVSIWYLLARVSNSYLLPYPHDIVYALIDLVSKDNLVYNILISIYRVTIGFGLSIFLGLLLGFLILTCRFARDLVYPITIFIIVTPAFAFIPLLMIWVGLNNILPITATILCSSFPIIYSITSSVKRIDRELVDVAILSGANKPLFIRKIVLPLSITHIAPILKIEAGHSWKIVLVTEFLTLPDGLGSLLLKAYSLLRVDKIIALILIIGLLTLAFQYMIDYIETLVVKRWYSYSR